jgi:hypothetical protein
VLERNGHQVLTAISAEDGIEVASASNPTWC